MESTDQKNSKISCRWIYVLLLVPVASFIVALFVRPAMVYDTAAGFLVLRDMLDGGPFNYYASPDPANIADNIETFMAWWTPGQYLAPGLFVSLGANVGLAICLTALIAAVVGVLGWIRIARNYEVSCFVLGLFVIGLVTFHYTLLPFRLYNGGEVLLFAVLPWSLLALQWALQKRSAVCFAVSLLTAGLLFLAKFSGLFAFVANVAAISVLDLLKRRQLTFSLLAMWAGSAVAALLLMAFWMGHGKTPVTVTGYIFTWPAILFPIAAAVFSGFSLHELLAWLFLHPSAPVLTGIAATSYVLGPLGLLLMGWVWLQLRNTRFRTMAACFLTIIAFYTAALVVIYVRNAAAIPFEERYFRYAGILFFLLLLVALDQWRGPVAKAIPILIVGGFAAYGLASHAKAVRDLTRGHYDQASGTSMLSVSPAVLAYLRSEMAAHNWKNAIALVPGPEAANGLPHFRVIWDFLLLDNLPLDEIAPGKLAGRTDKVFVIMDKHMRDDRKAVALLKAFVDYDFEKWSRTETDGMLIYSQ